jgi:hypothetical protein
MITLKNRHNQLNLGRGKKLNNTMHHYNSDNSIDQEPMPDTYLDIDEICGDHNYGNLQIEQAQQRAAFYLPRLIDYNEAIDDKKTIAPEDILGLIIHYPNELPLALDYTTTFQYGIFPAIQANTTEENQPIMLITMNGLQEIHADDLRNKYADTLTKLFSGPVG